MVEEKIHSVQIIGKRIYKAPPSIDMIWSLVSPYNRPHELPSSSLPH